MPDVIISDSVSATPTVLADVPTTPTTPTTPIEPVTPTVQAGSDVVIDTPKPLVGADGKFSESWRDGFSEDVRDAACWENVTDLENMAKQFVNQRSAIGKDSIVMPKEGAEPEEWNTFYKAIGRPDAPTEYQCDVPNELKPIFSDERVGKARELAHKLGISNAQFTAYMQHEMQEAAVLLETKATEEGRVKQAAEQALRTEYGAAFDERMHVAKRLVAEAIPNEEGRMAFLEKFGNDTDFIRFASVVGARLVEHKALVANLTEDAPGDALHQIKELQRKPGYMSADSTEMTNDEREAITVKIRDLHKIAYPTTPNTRLG